MLRRFFKYKIVRLILWAHVFLILIIMGFFFYLKYSNNNAYKTAITKTPYDVIIVPGYPYKGQWHDIMKTRVYWSKYLWEQGYTKNIIYSGSAVYSPYIESIIMKQYALALGIPENVIFTETQAEHSTENLFFSYQQARGLGFKKIALATDPVQSFFLNWFASDKEMDIKYLPIQYPILDEMNLENVKIDPDIAFKKEFKALPDRETFWQRLQGTIGKNIDVEK
ncbi:MAG: YdcF family protein [Fulvivirga sp.]